MTLSDSVGRLLNGLHRALKLKLAARQGSQVTPNPQTPNPNPC
jgi:hypothetical protein